jgi:hypothetical protein
VTWGRFSAWQRLEEGLAQEKGECNVQSPCGLASFMYLRSLLTSPTPVFDATLLRVLQREAGYASGESNDPSPLFHARSCPNGGFGGGIALICASTDQAGIPIDVEMPVERRQFSPKHDAQLLLGSKLAVIAPGAKFIETPRLRAGMACASAARLAAPSKPQPGFRWRSVRWR